MKRAKRMRRYVVRFWWRERDGMWRECRWRVPGLEGGGWPLPAIPEGGLELSDAQVFRFAPPRRGELARGGLAVGSGGATPAAAYAKLCRDWKIGDDVEPQA
jgi:hypothetical protein